MPSNESNVSEQMIGMDGQNNNNKCNGLFLMSVCKYV